MASSIKTMYSNDTELWDEDQIVSASDAVPDLVISPAQRSLAVGPLQAPHGEVPPSERLK